MAESAGAKQRKVERAEQVLNALNRARQNIERLKSFVEAQQRNVANLEKLYAKLVGREV